MPQSTTSRSILVVDDDELLRTSLAYTLEQAGYQVQTADSAQSAIGIVESSSPNLVLLDIGLPDMTGLEAIRRIRDISPVIFVSGRRRELDEVLGLELGAEDFITKPFAPEVLLARIRTVLRREQLPSPTAQPAPTTLLVVGDLQIDVDTHTVTCNRKQISLSPLSFAFCR